MVGALSVLTLRTFMLAQPARAIFWRHLLAMRTEVTTRGFFFFFTMEVRFLIIIVTVHNLGDLVISSYDISPLYIFIMFFIV